MTNEQKRIESFMTFFGQQLPGTPTQIDFETCKLRANLMLEELFELCCKGLGLKINLVNEKNCLDQIEISEDNLKDISFHYEKVKDVDLEQVADGVGDGIVTGLGTASACGLDQEEINLEIFDSNDSKSWNKEDLERARLENPGCIIEKYYGNLYRVKRVDGKILKSPTYTAPKIKEIIEKQIKDSQKSALQKELDKLGVQADVTRKFQ